MPGCASSPCPEDPTGPPLVSVKEKQFQIDSSDFLCRGCNASIDPETHYYSSVAAFEDRFVRRNFCEACWKRRPEDCLPLELLREPEEDAVSAEAGEDLQEAEGPQGVDEVSSEMVPVFAYWRTQRPAERDADQPLMRFDPEVCLEFFRKLNEDVLAAGEGETQEDPAPPGASESAPTSPSGGRTVSLRQKRDLAFVLSLLLIRKKVLVFKSSALSEDSEWLQLSVRQNPEREFWVENPQLSDAELEQVRDDIGALLHMRV